MIEHQIWQKASKHKLQLATQKIPTGWSRQVAAVCSLQHSEAVLWCQPNTRQPPIEHSVARNHYRAEQAGENSQFSASTTHISKQVTHKRTHRHCRLYKAKFQLNSHLRLHLQYISMQPAMLTKRVQQHAAADEATALRRSALRNNTV